MKTPCKQIVYELHISSILNAVYNAARASFLDHGKQAQTKRGPSADQAQTNVSVGTVRAQTKDGPSASQAQTNVLSIRV